MARLEIGNREACVAALRFIGFKYLKMKTKTGVDLSSLGLEILQEMQYDIAHIMTHRELKAGRMKAAMTQLDAAARLGVSQPYLSQLERGRRPVTAALARRAASLYQLPATALPIPENEPGRTDPDKLARELAALGYPGFAHLRAGTRAANPAVVVRDALVQKDLETRLSEAMPWVVMKYPHLNWGWLVKEAKLHDVQNRLGFVVDVAREVAARSQPQAALEALSEVTQQLEHSRLARVDTLCRDSMSSVEREWLSENRSPVAKRWNLLTGLTPEQLTYAA